MSELMLSVAIITYNQEKYIAQTLDSILQQEHNYSYEIVIGEDCSTDGTRKIIEEYVTKYPKIIKPLYNNPNKGLIDNYFNVIANCSGKYIMECGGDDYWLPQKVMTQIDFMEKNSEIGMCFTKTKQLFSDMKEICDVDSNINVTFDNLLSNNLIPALTVCVRRNLMNQYFQEINPVNKGWLMEDYPMWLWISKKTKIYFIDKFTTVYRVLNESISHSLNYRKQLSFAKSIVDIKKFYAKYFNIELSNEYINNSYNEIFNNIFINYCIKRTREDKCNINELYSLYVMPTFTIKLKKMIANSLILSMIFKIYYKIRKK